MIGKNIAKIRKKRGYTLSKLAELSDISKSYLSNIERNINKNPSLEVIQRIATILQVNLSTLVEAEIGLDQHQTFEQEWVNFLKTLKELGIEREQIHQY